MIEILEESLELKTLEEISNITDNKLSRVHVLENIDNHEISIMTLGKMEPINSKRQLKICLCYNN